MGVYRIRSTYELCPGPVLVEHVPESTWSDVMDILRSHITMIATVVRHSEWKTAVCDVFFRCLFPRNHGDVI